MWTLNGLMLCKDKKYMELEKIYRKSYDKINLTLIVKRLIYLDEMKDISNWCQSTKKKLTIINACPHILLIKEGTSPSLQTDM